MLPGRHVNGFQLQFCLFYRTKILNKQDVLRLIFHFWNDSHGTHRNYFKELSRCSATCLHESFLVPLIACFSPDIRPIYISYINIYGTKSIAIPYGEGLSSQELFCRIRLCFHRLFVGPFALFFEFAKLHFFFIL